MSARITAALAITVTSVWSLSMIVDVLNSAYDPPAGIHGALMLVLGGVFGARLAGRSDA